MWKIILFIFIVLLLVAVCICVYNKINPIANHSASKISFKESLDLTDLPVITLLYGKHKFNLILDTGANRSYLNESLVKKLNIPTTDTSLATITAQDRIENVPRTPAIELKYKDYTITVEFAVIDISSAIHQIKKETGVTIHGFIGTDVLAKYKYILDFKKCILHK